jgi:glycosyltransferase involved in cell wall biosynthesis
VEVSALLGGIRLWEVARSLRRSDMVLFSNSPDLEYAVARLGVSRARAHVVPNGVPPPFLERPLEYSPPGADAPIRIAQVASYIPRKGVKYGAEALNRLLRRHPRVEVSFLGTGHDEQTVLRDLDPEIRSQVTVRPRFQRDELPELLKGHQIKLLPTTFEGFSVALIEAMACGLAPVTTSTAGSLEVVRDGSNGLLVPARDSKALEAALEKLIEDPVLLQRLRRGAYETAQGYSWPSIAERTLALYEQAAKAKLGYEAESSQRA